LKSLVTNILPLYGIMVKGCFAKMEERTQVTNLSSAVIAMVSRPCTPHLECHNRTAFLIASNLLLKLCDLLYSLVVWLAYPEVSPSDQLTFSKYYQSPVSVSFSHSVLHGLSFLYIDITVTES
jgi:hypothetical protein